MKKIIVNGTFDVLHPGHIQLLNAAKAMGDYLLVCIDSDCRVRKLKGNSRPIYNEYVRATMLQNLKAVDNVLVFNSEDELCDIIKHYDADIMFKGSDYIGKDIVGAQYCKEIIYYDRIEEYSTTKTIQNIIDR